MNDPIPTKLYCVIAPLSAPESETLSDFEVRKFEDCIEILCEPANLSIEFSIPAARELARKIFMAAAL